MKSVTKIGLIAFLSVLSAALLLFFVLLNFPYGAAVKRLDLFLAKEHGTNLSVGRIRYRYPFHLVLGDLRLSRKDGSFSVKVDDLNVRVHLLSFRGSKKVEIGGGGVQVKSGYVVSSKSRVSLLSRVRLPTRRAKRAQKPVPGPASLPLDYLSLTVQGTEIERVSIAGFEFTSFKVPVIELVLQNVDRSLEVKRGNVKSDLFTSEISGAMDAEIVDLSIVIRMSAEFFKRYAALSGFFDQIGKDGTIRMRIQGKTRSPAVKIIQ